MGTNFIEGKRTELLAQCIEKDKEISKDPEFANAFNKLWQSIILDMIEGADTFFANFIVELRRELDYDLQEPMCTIPQYNYFRLVINPIYLLECTIREIQALLKHEVYHILSLHHYRSQVLLKNYSKLAVNLAMDISVNQYIINLPNWANTIEKVSLSYNVNLQENQALELYTHQIQEALNRKIQNVVIGEEIETDNLSSLEVGESHHTWMDENLVLDEEHLKEIVDKLLENINNVSRPDSVSRIVEDSRAKPKLSWQKLLIRSFGTTPWKKKKTITRRDRRMPDRLDLRGTITHYISEVIVAIDISGSMTEKEIDDILTEIKALVRNYNSKITVLECDDELRRIYSLQAGKPIKKRPKASGKTKFSPVFEYIRKRNLYKATLIYFTDGLGEEIIDQSIVHYKTIWVITTSENKLSLKNPPGHVINLGSRKKNNEEMLPLDLLKSELKEIRSEWAK
ncbi:VWA-like domain-containing protein [Clostridium thermarum]|uniref:vWA domain-containing protein n=1 Tax=Clostridium thermarum TaxID=1716543 RepID=UPI0013D583B8|nr:VWA-like domain-containing protein [Clostridium thermarum]